MPDYDVAQLHKDDISSVARRMEAVIRAWVPQPYTERAQARLAELVRYCHFAINQENR